MPASLCIQVRNVVSTDIQEIKIFDAGEWNADSEKELLVKMQDILSLVRSIGNTCEININLEVRDTQAALFLIRKRASAQLEINHQKLTIREIEILGLIMQGMTNNEIAEKLFISYETVKSHRSNILEKTGAKNTAALINYYHQTFFEK